MSYNLDPMNENVRRIAQRLALHNQSVTSEHSTKATTDGISIPTWMLYVSEAHHLWINHLSVNDLNWDGTKTP